MGKLPQKPQGDASVWRYMDFTKFMSLLESSSLIFCRADKFEDPYEGIPSESILKEIEQIEHEDSSSREEIETFFRNLKRMREHCFVCCWHLNEVDSDAMWKIFVKSDEGIAIKTKFSILEDQVTKNCQMTSRLGMVSYDPPGSIFALAKDMHAPIFYKRKSFEHEREVRALIISRSTKEIFSSEAPQPPILSVRVDLTKLINEVHISPAAPPWICDLVREVLKRYQLSNIPVSQSQLLTKHKYLKQVE